MEELFTAIRVTEAARRVWAEIFWGQVTGQPAVDAWKALEAAKDAEEAIRTKVLAEEAA